MPPDLILEALTSWQKSVQQHYASHWLLGPGLARAEEATPRDHRLVHATLCPFSMTILTPFPSSLFASGVRVG